MIYTSLDSSVAIENVDQENQNTDFVEKLHLISMINCWEYWGLAWKMKE